VGRSHPLPTLEREVTADLGEVVKAEPEGRSSPCAASLDTLFCVQETCCSGMEVAEPHGAAPSLHGRQSCWSDNIPHRLLDAWWCLNQPDVRLRAGQAREKSLVQLLAHRACHRAVPESMVTELHGRLRWWQCGRQPAAQTGRAMHNAIPTCARNSVDSEAPQCFLIAVVPRYTPDAGEACLEALHSSAEGVTDWGVATDGLLYVLGVPFAPESASTLQLQRAKLTDAVVLANCKGLAHTVAAPDEALAKCDQLCMRQRAGEEQGADCILVEQGSVMVGGCPAVLHPQESSLQVTRLEHYVTGSLHTWPVTVLLCSLVL
jgi:hypothetical protein